MNTRTISHAVDGLSLAATPTFALMALLSALPGAPDMLCASASPLTGMTAMYALMSAFHLSPWLKLLAAHLSSRAQRGIQAPSLDPSLRSG